jgi:DNA modification methylase
MNIPIEEILVVGRARKDFGDLEELQSSIEKHGLLNEILVKTISQEDGRKYKLIAGERRLRCHKNLGLTHIKAKIIDTPTLLKEKEIELVENYHKEFTWQEKALLIDDIHRLHQEEFGVATQSHDSDGWGMKQTAELLKISLGTVHQSLELADALKTMPTIKRYKSKKQALKNLSKVTAHMARRRLAELESEKDPRYSLFNADAYKILRDNFEDETVDLVIFDPPWGTGADSLFNARGSGERAEYEDSPEVFKEISETLLPELFRVLKNNAHMYMFFGIETYEYLFSFLQKVGFNVERVPLIWVKEGGAWVPDHEKKLQPRYEMFLLMSKGFRPLELACSNVFIYPRPPTIDRIHTQQKSNDLLKQLIRLSTVPDNLVLDPCMGSGATIVASLETNRRSVGIEKVQSIFDAAKCWITGEIMKGEEE